MGDVGVDADARSHDGLTMSVWAEHSVEDKVIEALKRVHPVSAATPHHFGRPWVTAYQLAIIVDLLHPDLRQAMNSSVGGAGTRKSLAQYLANQLSRRIKSDGADYPVEGAFLANDHVVDLAYETGAGDKIHSSLTGSGYDLSMFRLRS